MQATDLGDWLTKQGFANVAVSPETQKASFDLKISTQEHIGAVLRRGGATGPLFGPYVLETDEQNYILNVSETEPAHWVVHWWIRSLRSDQEIGTA